MELFFLALLVIIMATALASGYPVAFALPGSAIITISLAALAGYVFAGDSSAYFAQGGPVQWLSAGVTNFRGIYWEVERDTLIAIPLFIFMGIMLQRSKIAEDLLITMAQLFGPVPGGLGISVVFVGALLAATTGILGATVVAMGLISLPAMRRHNYSDALATGTIAASGTLGQIIPPSIVLIILADQLSSAVDQADTARKALYKATTGELSMPSEFSVASTSAGDMFLGAFIPGLVLVGLYMLFILVIAIIRPKLAPAIPFEGKYDRKFLIKVIVTLVPPLTLIFVVLGSILAGVATVNQAGAIGAIGAMVMAGYRLMEGKKRAFYPALMAGISIVVIAIILENYSTNIKNIKTTDDMIGIGLAVTAVTFLITSIIWSGWRVYRIENTLHGVMVDTAKTTSLVFIILLGAAMLTAAFRAFGGEELVREFLTGLSGGFWAQFVIVMAVIFLLGFFLDFIEIAVVVVPIVAPILLLDPGANVTAVWLGVMIGLNIQTSFLTPPFGFALFYLRGVATSAVRTIEMYKGVIPFIGLQLVALFIVAEFPALVNYLPNRVSLTSETAPPPLNPRLQFCMEKYVFTEFETGEDNIRLAIATAQKLDFSYLPKKQRTATKESFGSALAVFDRRADIENAESKITAAKPAYAPLHRQVRALQKKMRKIDKEIKLTKSDIRRKKSDDIKTDDLDEFLAALQASRKQLEASIPDDWEKKHKIFTALMKDAKTARRNYQRTTDGAYEAIQALITNISGTEKLTELGPDIEKLSTAIAGLPPKEASKVVRAVSKRLNSVGGTRAIKKELTKARKAMRGRKAKPEKVEASLKKAIEIYQADLVWRQRAATELLPKLNQYDLAIRDTIGLRLQPGLPREQALWIANCNSVPRDISLNF